MVNSINLHAGLNIFCEGLSFRCKDFVLYTVVNHW